MQESVLQSRVRFLLGPEYPSIKHILFEKGIPGVVLSALGQYTVDQLIELSVGSDYTEVENVHITSKDAYLVLVELYLCLAHEQQEDVLVAVESKNPEVAQRLASAPNE